MLANLNREDFIALLDKLGSADDAEVLSAARDLHAKVAVSGLGWDALLAPNPSEADGADDEDEAEGPAGPSALGDDSGLVAPDADLSPITEDERAEAHKLIESIGALKISETTREELAQYKSDLADSAFEKMDLRYLRALHKRLAG